MEIADKAYAAGLFDGEGYVDIYKATLSKASKSLSLMLRVVISQKDGKIMNWLVSKWGGHVNLSRQDKHYIYRWDIRSQAAYKFLSDIRPYIQIKDRQVNIALAFEYRKANYKFSGKGLKGFQKISEEELTARLALKDELKRLKKEYMLYTKQCAGSTTKRENISKEIMQ